ncbi:MAG: hypothetical protein H7Z42_03010 [Roseiflexaceae bacterium]|nr:hypothetical protein [Roseiflexaceae bacterium]
MPLTWTFPLPRTHTGVLLGNGVQGLMVWGSNSLNITVGRAGFWDHRGGNAFASRTTFADVRALLEADDEAGIQRAFADPQPPLGQPAYPTQIGGGRIELCFDHHLRPIRGELDTRTGTLRVTLGNTNGLIAMVVIRQAIGQEVAWVEFDEQIGDAVAITVVPTWQYVGQQLSQVGCQPPETWQGATSGGFCQYLPADDPLALAWERHGATLVFATVLGQHAAHRAQRLAHTADIHAAARATNAWWATYWETMPRVQLSDPVLQHAWEYGTYKLAGLTTPGGVAATLQGPWIEEYQLPPWSCDYHFNINIQMIYWPCLITGRFAHVWPLWDMILGWMPQLQENATRFFGVQDALLMPHAVDDRCTVVGTFWTGMIDQACTAWMAQLAWLHYQYSGDERVLREVARPLLSGAFNGYWATLETTNSDGRERLSLPVSVSPEYNAAGMNAWGRDASFQLAALHFLAQSLPLAAYALGQPIDPRWQQVRDQLPAYSCANGEQRHISLWQGQDLATSHRHHSHLGAIYPFRTLDPLDPAHAPVVHASLRHWVARGAGAWTGWCVPWASILCARANWADAAVTWLHWWNDVFTNEGHGTLHNAAHAGTSVFEPTTVVHASGNAHVREVMQIEAGMGAVTAIAELLVQCRGALIVVLPRIPVRWTELRFDDLWTEGGFRIGATVQRGQVVEVRVHATRRGQLGLAHGISGQWRMNTTVSADTVLNILMQPDERLVMLKI